MFEHASLIPPHVTPPDPLIVKVVVAFFSILMSFALIVFIGFVGIEFLAEMAGYPFNFEAQLPTEGFLLSEEQDALLDYKSPFELITPKHHTRMRGPEVAVIYTRRLPNRSAAPPVLLLGGIPHPWEKQFGDSTWFARLLLSAGQHHLQVEESEAEFFVETLDSPLQAPEEWVRHNPHPDTDKTDRCSDCHEMGVDPLMQSRNQAIGAWQGFASCFACHDSREHEIRHAIIPLTTDRCLRCHAVH